MTCIEELSGRIATGFDADTGTTQGRIFGGGGFLFDHLGVQEHCRVGEYMDNLGSMPQDAVLGRAPKPGCRPRGMACRGSLAHKSQALP
jgi:hypothetical protein